jgi:ribose/xylose/arabinose/galactoside ABC-type transport system permease subunit
LLLIAGYVDLSVGSTMALSATAGALVMASTQSVLLGLLTCCGVGAGVGILNGVLTAQFSFSPIIVTLATLTAGRGLAEAIFNSVGQTIGTIPASVTSFGVTKILGIPVLALIGGVVLIGCGFLLRYAPTGRHLYAIGVNQRAAYLSGIEVKRIVTLLYIGVGLVTGLAGMLYITRYVGVQPATVGLGFEIEVLTAVLLGGIAFTGGRGTIVGAALGVLFLGVLSAGLQQMAVLPATQLLIQGIALGLAAGLQWWRSRLEA